MEKEREKQVGRVSDGRVIHSLLSISYIIKHFKAAFFFLPSREREREKEREREREIF